MNFGYTGLCVAVLVLLAMLMTCHLKKYFNSSVQSARFINLAIPTGTIPINFNQISYSNNGYKIPCEIAAQANIPCSQIQKPCLPTNITQPQIDLSDSEIAVIYKEAYEQAGLELMRRALAA